MTTPGRPLKKRQPEAKAPKEKANTFLEDDEEKSPTSSEGEVREGAQCVG